MQKILAADDSEPMRKLVSLVLTNAGYSVDVAVDGVEALELFKNGDYKLVITDINMPRMMGLDLIREIRGQNNDVPILALTTEDAQAMRQKGQSFGADGWIVKPFKPAQFLDIVKQVLA